MNIITINSTGKERPPDVGVQSTKVYLVCNEPFPARVLICLLKFRSEKLGLKKELCEKYQSTKRINVIFKGPWKVKWRRQWHPTPVLLPGKTHGQRSLVGCSPWGRYESDRTKRLHFHFHTLENEMATHSSVLAWRIPGTGEPGGLPSMGSHRVRRD